MSSLRCLPIWRGRWLDRHQGRPIICRWNLMLKSVGWWFQAKRAVVAAIGHRLIERAEHTLGSAAGTGGEESLCVRDSCAKRLIVFTCGKGTPEQKPRLYSRRTSIRISDVPQVDRFRVPLRPAEKAPFFNYSGRKSALHRVCPHRPPYSSMEWILCKGDISTLP